MEQIIPVEDEESGAELRVINASFADPYLLILREDSSVKLFKTNESGELEEVESNTLSSTKWLTASLFTSSALPDIFAFLLMPEGGLQVCLVCTTPSRWCLMGFLRSLRCQTFRNQAMWQKGLGIFRHS
jgi:hypothetical protein